MINKFCSYIIYTMDLFKLLDNNPIAAFLFGGTMFVIFTKFINSKWLKKFSYTC